MINVPFRPIKCKAPECKKERFPNWNAFDEHRRRVHGAQCPDCGKYFTNAGTLAPHMRRMHVKNGDVRRSIQTVLLSRERHTKERLKFAYATLVFFRNSAPSCKNSAKDPSAKWTMSFLCSFRRMQTVSYAMLFRNLIPDTDRDFRLMLASTALLTLHLIK